MKLKKLREKNWSDASGHGIELRYESVWACESVSIDAAVKVCISYKSFAAKAYHSIQSKESETLERAVLARTDNGWKTFFHGDDELEGKEPVVGMLTGIGDGHGTQKSQEWLSTQERAVLAASTVYVSGGHFSLILDPKAEALLSRIFKLKSR